MPDQKSQATIVTSVIISIIISVSVFLIFSQVSTPRIAYVTNSKLLAGFNEAINVEKELLAKDSTWRAEFKSKQDSGQAMATALAKEFDKASPARKDQIQAAINAKNNELAKFQQDNTQKLEKLRQEKLTQVYDKINAYLAEYGKKHHYSIIFGTVAGGSIVYANEKKYEITDVVLKGLNEKYK